MIKYITYRRFSISIQLPSYFCLSEPPPFRFAYNTRNVALPKTSVRACASIFEVLRRVLPQGYAPRENTGCLFVCLFVCSMKLLRTCITYVQGHMGYPSSYALVLFRYSKVTPYQDGGTRDGGPGEITDRVV